MKIALFLFAAIAIPLVALRGRALRRSLATELGAALAFIGFAAWGRVLHVDVDPYLALLSFGAIILAIPLGFLAFSGDVRWSANRAFLIAAIGYTVMIPLQLRTPIDGDEPYYLLMTESLVRDHDLDLANQYRDIAHSDTDRPDLLPQQGDPRGAHGEQYSRHEPFLPILMAPGYALGGVPGALAVIALFGALLARSTVRFLEDEGIDDATTRALFPLVVFGPPIVFYATRIWPEVPAAFCFVEALRGVRQRRPPRWIAAIFALVLLKIRFGLIAIVLLARALRTRRQLVIAGAAVAVPLFVAWLITGNPINTHTWRELMPNGLSSYGLGLFGLVLDGAAGLLFQAPLFALAIVIALPRWKEMPEGFRLGVSTSLLYVAYLVPRSEWHGGWSPPLRYIVVFMPVLALGCAAVWQRVGSGVRAIITGWTLMLVVHGAVFPWRLFHLATGENFIGESLSETWHSDFSRLMPSFIRPNLAATVGSIVLIGIMIAVLLTAILSRARVTRVTRRTDGPIKNRAPFSPMLFVGEKVPKADEGALQQASGMTTALAPLLLAALFLTAFTYGPQPAGRVEFEDAHVTHNGGEMFPAEWTVSRFLYQGGWIIRAGDTLSFLARKGASTLRYQSRSGATIEIGGHAFVLPASGAIYGYATIYVERDGRAELRCVDGVANLDWMQHD